MADKNDILISIKGWEFVIHWAINEYGYIEAEVYRAEIYEDGSYTYEEEPHADGSTQKIHFLNYTYRWRGVWEGRVYFKRSEYWGELMEVIHLLWQQIEPRMQEALKPNGET